MINKVIEAISKNLYTEFGYKVHMEEIKQGLQEPCFFIQCLNPAFRRFLGERYLRNNQFAIQYFPQSKNAYQRECNQVAETLIWLLKWITLDGEKTPIQGTEMNYEITEGVLHFFVNYDFFVRREIEKDEMETMTDETGAEG